MESKRIVEILDQVNNCGTYKKIFINGPWGIGKSYYADQYVKSNDKNIIYVSLFGKSNFESIENELAKQLIKKLNRINKGRKKIKSFYNKLRGSFSFYGISICTPQLARKGIISEYSSILESKSLIIIVDDLERKSGNILIEDIMGMIEEFSMFEKVKLVVIGDEDNMNTNDQEKWRKFKEKIIEKEYKINKFSDESINNLVRNEIINYVDNNEIELFIDEYIKKHRIKNLRTIIKGINLFKEIFNNYIEIKNNNRVNLMLLKNCVSVVIESTEQLYKPIEENKQKNPIQYTIDEDIVTRIAHHYFAPIYVKSNETCVLNYVLKIFNCDYDFTTIENINYAIRSYLNINVEEKNIFYLSEEEISIRVNGLYNKMVENKYEFISLDDFIDDFYEICNWNDKLGLKIHQKDLSIAFNDILFKNYYNVEKYIDNNKINRFMLKRNDSKSLDNLIHKYNEAVDTKFLDDRLLLIIDSFNNKEYNEELFEWLEFMFLQDDKKNSIDRFITHCRNNNFFIPDISGEISDNLWGWIHKIWKIFSEKMNDGYKKEFNAYVQTLKVNKLSSYRIDVLQEYSPIVLKFQ